MLPALPWRQPGRPAGLTWRIASICRASSGHLVTSRCDRNGHQQGAVQSQSACIHAIAASGLGAIQAGIGHCQQLLRRGLRIRNPTGDANADGDHRRRVGIAVFDTPLLYGLAQCLGLGKRCIQVTLRQQADKLLATIARDQVMRTPASLTQHIGNLLQADVPCG